MFAQINFQDSFSEVIKHSTFSFFSTTIFLALLHFGNEIKNVGSLTSLYIPGLLISLDIVKHVIFTGITGFPASLQNKQTKWNILNGIILILISIASYFILAILFGAKAFSEHEETLMFAIFLTVCTTIHCLINIGFKDFNKLFVKANNMQYSDEYVFNSAQVVAVCSIIGCWSSAVVIPLDWDRWWQKWPIPCVIGTIFGYNCGFIVSILLGYMYDKSKMQKRKRHV